MTDNRIADLSPEDDQTAGWSDDWGDVPEGAGELERKPISAGSLVGGIRGKLTVLLLAFGLLPALGLFAILFNQQSAVKEMLQTRVSMSAQSITEAIDRNLFERYGDVQAFGLNSAAQAPDNWTYPSPRNPLITAMNGYMTGYGIYKLMLLLGPDGNVLAVNSTDADGKPLETKPLYDRNFKQERWFADAFAGRFLKGKDGFTGTAVGQPYREKLVADLYKSDGYVIPFSAPVKDFAGNVVAIWVNFADFGLVEEIVSRHYATFAADNMGNAELTILDPRGRVIVDYDPKALGFENLSGYKRNFDVIGKLNLAEKGVEAALRAVKGESGAMVSTHARKQIVQASGYARSRGIYDYPGLGWSTLVRIPTGEAFAMWDNLLLVMIIALAVAAAAITAGGMFIGHRAAQPIRALTGVMTRLADGDKTVEILTDERSDEIGDMTRTVQVFKDGMIETERLQTEQREAERQAQEEEMRRADESREAERREAAQRQREAAERQERADRIEKLIAEFDREVTVALEAVASAAAEMQGSAQTMSAGAEQTSRQATAVAAASEEASTNVQTVATATEELSSSIAEISRQVAQSNQIAQNAIKEAKHTNTRVEGLAEAAQKIGDVVSLINDIASQTNLLALNATIEAARAGEAGKGFAVVASEVKSLATQTSKATEEIGAQIAAIQGATEDAVQAIQGIGATIGEIGEIATSVASAVEKQGAATGEIATNVQQAAAGTQEVSGNINQVTEAANESKAASSQMLDAANALAQQGEVLRREVDRFLKDVRAA